MYSSDSLAPLRAHSEELSGTHLDLTIRKTRHELENISIAVNGLQVAAGDGWVKLDRVSDTLVRFDGRDYRVGAHESFRDFFAGLLRHQGQLEISIQGRNLHVVAAKLVADWCETGPGGGSPPPSPTPAPPPPAPVTRIDGVSSTETLTASTTLQASFSSDTAGASFACSLDFGSLAPCSSPHTLSGLASGAHRFTVVATNPSGITDPIGASHAWTVDAVAPSVQIVSASPAGAVTNSTAMSLEVSASETSSFQCALDGGAWLTCASPAVFSGLAEGDHRVEVRAVDPAGNVSGESALHSWRIDTTVPIVTLLEASPAGSVNASSTLQLAFSANESAVFTCALDGAGDASCASPFAVSGLAEGAHSLAIRAIDPAGNPSASATYSWRTDQTRPAIGLGSVQPTPGGVTNARELTVEFTLGEPGQVLCSLDAGAASPCTSPARFSLSAEGPHRVQLTAVDEAGNAAHPVDLSWTMDFFSPQISFGVFTPSGASQIASRDLTVAITANEPVTYRSSLDGRELGQTESPIALRDLSEGPHSLVIEAADGAGNPANSIRHDFTVDLTAPVVSIDASGIPASILGGLTALSEASFAFVSTEAGRFECELDRAGFAACASPALYGGLAQGGHLFRVRAFDAAGNVSTPATHAWTVDLTEPDSSITGADPAGATIATKSIRILFSASEGGTFECRLDETELGTCTSPIHFAPLAEGAHLFQVRAKDYAGNRESSPASYGFTVDTLPPAVTIYTSTAPLTAAAAASFQLAADEPATFECAFDSRVYSPCESAFTMGPLLDGSHEFRVIGTDSRGNRGTSPTVFSWTVDLTPPMTSVSAVQTPALGPSVDFSLASSEPGSTFVCSLDGESWRGCASPVAYAGLADGGHVFAVRAIDGAGNADPIGATATVLVFSSITTGIASWTPGVSLANQATASFELVSNIPGASFECSLDGAPAVPCSSPAGYSGLTQGAHGFRAWAVYAERKDELGATVSWAVDTIAPLATSITTSVTSASFTVSWTTSEPTTTAMNWGVGSDTSQVGLGSSALTTSHSMTVGGLAPLTVYSYKLGGKDAAGNALVVSRRSLRTGQ